MEATSDLEHDIWLAKIMAAVRSFRSPEHLKAPRPAPPSQRGSTDGKSCDSRRERA